MHATIRLVTLTLTFALSTNASAWRLRVHPDCPGSNPKVTWQQYMAGTIPKKNGIVSSFVGLEFRTAKALNDKAAIDGLRTDVCYASRYVPGQGYITWRNGDKLNPNAKERMPGNPLDFEINVWGSIFLFDKHGQVLDKKGRVVGRLTCYVSNECSRY